MDLKFDANGLIPAIVQDHYTMSYMRVAYQIILRGFFCIYIYIGKGYPLWEIF